MLAQKKSFTFSGTNTLYTPGGNYFRLYSTSSVVTVKGYAKGVQVVNLEDVQQGMSVEVRDLEGRLVYCEKFEVTSAGAQTITYAVGTSSIHDDAVSGNTTATIVQPTTVDSLADDSIAATTTEQVSAADSTRHALIVQNLPTNTAAVRVGDSGAGAANGIYLEPGMSVTIPGTAAVYVYNTHSAAQSVALLAIKA